MKMVIEIDEEDWKDINDIHFIREDLKFKIGKVIMKGTPLPEHHGDLIDRNELLDESYQIDSMYCVYDEVVNVDDIKNAPTIIEAGGSDSK